MLPNIKQQVKVKLIKQISTKINKILFPDFVLKNSLVQPTRYPNLTFL